MQNKTLKIILYWNARATFEDPDIIFESTNLFKNLHDKFETSEERVRGKTKCYVFTRVNFFHCEIFLLWKNFSENSASACFEIMEKNLHGYPLLTPLSEERLKIYQLRAVLS